MPTDKMDRNVLHCDTTLRSMMPEPRNTTSVGSGLKGVRGRDCRDAHYHFFIYFIYFIFLHIKNEILKTLTLTSTADLQAHLLMHTSPGSTVH